MYLILISKNGALLAYRRIENAPTFDITAYLLENFTREDGRFAYSVEVTYVEGEE